MSRSYGRGVWMLVLLVANPVFVSAAEDQPANSPAAAAPAADTPSFSVEQLTESARKAVVVVTVTGRDGKQQGLGSGFVISADGLIATNMHVIGEGRPIVVQMADGKKFEVTAVHAFDRPLDLALLRVAATDLPVLPLGDSSALKQGQPIVALGNPLGLKHSVVTGVVSGTREIEGREMIQLAIPIEPGNSGGPLLDLQGRVQGILTMKSAVTQNLGFAMPVNALKSLVAKPNPTLMSKWLTIGALDPQEWTTLFGANWRQRAGRILVDGKGGGIGSRSLCLSQELPPESPFEVGVSVRLDQESGAAGLAFCSNGGDLHYGFYPSNGGLRLTRFDGPDVYYWHVLAELRHPSYKPGDWNALKVRFDKGRIQCYVNDQLVIESTDARLAGGRVGLVKFRDTDAQFRAFRVGKTLVDARLSDEAVAKVKQTLADLPADPFNRPEIADSLADNPAGVAALQERATSLERQAQQLKKLSQVVHQRRVAQELVRIFEKPSDDEVDLFHAALMVAVLDNEEIVISDYRAELDRMARNIQQGLSPEADDAARLAALNRYLFDEQGFHGNRQDEFHRSNSYVNEVLDDREGLPITLSVIYMELSRKLGLKVVGLALPGRFMVRFEPTGGESQIIDVFERGAVVSRAAAEQLIRTEAPDAAIEPFFAPASKRAIVVRMLNNLKSVERNARNAEGMLRYQSLIVAVIPQDGRERFLRGMLLAQCGRRVEAIADADYLLQHRPDDLNLNEVADFRRYLDESGRQ
ncbi:MAG: trypsin-like peptidase domain-containing protein [Planctomycetes bacterium]|nr:trypsin-like peptidase domain-containing protein [Planctomycetota bacterium]